MKSSIRTRIVASYVAIALLVVVTVGAIFFVVIHRISDRARVALLEQIADAVAGTLERPEAEVATLAAQPALRRALDATSLFNNVRMRLVDSEGRVRYQSGRPDAIAFNIRIIEDFLTRRRSTPEDHVPGDVMMMRKQMAERQRGMFRFRARPVVPHPAPSEVTPPDSRREAEQTEPPREPAEPFRAELRRPVSIRGATWHLELMGAPGFEEDFLTPAAWVFAIAAVAALAATTGAGLWIGRRLTAPVIHLTEQARRMGEGDLSVRSAVRGSDEIGDLSRQFNTMADRLAGSFREISRERDTLRRFAGDASHELRTPLTALSTFVDLLEGAAATDTADGGAAHGGAAHGGAAHGGAAAARDRLRELIADSRGQIDRLQHLVDDLLSLTRLDGSVVELRRDAQEPAALAGAAWKSLDPQVRERGRLVVDPSLDALGPVTCDGDRMTTALKNLFENALHARPDATVTVSAERRRRGSADNEGASGGAARTPGGATDTPEAAATVVRVADDGPGVAEAELDRLFERFYRSPGNRSSGSGLGLSIVEGIVKLHGGSVRAYNRATRERGESGLVVELTIPGGAPAPE
ncbi:MAG: HAMP domain-containing sensor histidine kinase [Spirochaetota bacterium]